jgi:hypothetical protein
VAADLDLLLIAVFCTADDVLPKRAGNARRRITDAEVITLCIAQAMLGIASDERFLAVAAWRLSHLFPGLPTRDAFQKRRLRLAGAIEALIAEFARHSPGFYDRRPNARRLPDQVPPPDLSHSHGEKRIAHERPDACFHGPDAPPVCTPASRRRPQPPAARPRLCCRPRPSARRAPSGRVLCHDCDHVVAIADVAARGALRSCPDASATL